MTNIQRINAKRWAEAISSGKYKILDTAINVRMHESLQSICGFNPLGVACQIFKKELDLHPTIGKDDLFSLLYYNNNKAAVPPSVLNYIGIRQYGELVVAFQPSRNKLETIWDMNRYMMYAGYFLSYIEIANLIESQLQCNSLGLFI